MHVTFVHVTVKPGHIDDFIAATLENAIGGDGALIFLVDLNPLGPELGFRLTSAVLGAVCLFLGLFTLAAGIGAAARGSPISGASQGVPAGARKATTSAGRTDSMRASSASRSPRSSCSSRNIEYNTSRLSAGRQGCGVCRSNRYSKGRADRADSPAFTPPA